MRRLSAAGPRSTAPCSARLAALALIAVAVAVFPVAGSGTPAGEPQCLVVDVFAASTDEAAGPLMARLEAFARERGGITVVRRFIDTVPEDRAALAAAAGKHGCAVGALPVVLACGAAVSDAVVARVEAACRIEVYTRRGCSRCGKT